MRCPQCQQENPPQAKFCLECAQPVSAAPLARQRFGPPDSYTPKHLAEKILTSRAALEGVREMDMRFWLEQATAESTALA